MVSILAYGDTNYDFSQAGVYTYMDKIQLFIKSGKPKPGLSKFSPAVEYPMSVADLPEELKRFTYTDGSQQTDVTIPELDTILAGRKQRGRLKSGLPDWLQRVPETYHSNLAKDITGQSQAKRPHAGGRCRCGQART